MNDSTKIKILTMLVATLVLLNVSMMGYLWYGHHGGDDRSEGPRDGRGPGGLVIKELKFDEKQRQEFEKLREEHHATMVEIDRTSRQLHKQLFKTLSDSTDSKALSDSLFAQINKGEINRETITYMHLAQVRKLCNPEQKKIFDEMIEKASIWRPQGPPPPRE